MKTSIQIINLIIVSIFVITFTLSSCKKEKEDIPKPVISDLELGYNNSGTGILGSDLHLEASIVAEGKINKIEVHIHFEGGQGWEYENEFKGSYVGVKNITFHEHIAIPLGIDTGDYHFHFKVYDMEGNTAEVERELRITEPTDTTAPVITVTSAPANNQTYTTGQSISISGNITENIAIGGVYIGLVNITQALADADVNATNTITLLHTHSFTDPKNFTFSASLQVGATMDNNITPKPITWISGNYYILVKSKSAFGANWRISQQYPIIINL